jgi:hypothetical protein
LVAVPEPPPSTIRELIRDESAEARQSASVNDVCQAFVEFLNDIAGNHAMALAGVAITLQSVSAVELKNQTADSMNLVGYGDPNTGDGFHWQKWPLNSTPERLGPDGPVIRSIGQQWVAALAAQWNEDFRARFATALGMETNEVIDPAMGDMNKLRNDILHHRGIATQRNAGRCLNRWFAPGEPIHVMPVHVVQLMDYFGRVEITKNFDGGGLWDEFNVQLTPTEDT